MHFCQEYASYPILLDPLEIIPSHGKESLQKAKLDPSREKNAGSLIKGWSPGFLEPFPWKLPAFAHHLFSVPQSHAR